MTFLQEKITIRPPNSDAVSSGQNLESPKVALNIHIHRGTKEPFVLVHGLASNARTWDQVAAHLAEVGHTVVAVDQRGHGLSDKPDTGYDFATVAEDLRLLVEQLSLERPILVGQSWGGNVVLATGAIYPQLSRGLAFVDGGYLDLQMRPGATWERISKELRPPHLLGTERAIMEKRMRSFHPDWDEVGIQGSLANFETLADGTIRPWLTLERHMMILQKLWEQRPADFYPQVTVPVLIAAAKKDENTSRRDTKAQQIDAATAGLSRSAVHWFDQTDHDIHVHRPNALAQLFIDAVEEGFWP